MLENPRQCTKYKKTDGASGVHGAHYQLRLSLLFLLQGYKLNKPFSLSTDNSETGKFDDIVFETDEGTILLQAKHKKNDKRQVTLNNLFSTNRKAFNLHTYLESYSEIRNNFKNIDSLILCTNITINTDDSDTYISFKQLGDEHIFASNKVFTFNQTSKQKLTNYSSDVVDDFLKKFLFVSITYEEIENRIKTILSDSNYFSEFNSIDAVPNLIFLLEKNFETCLLNKKTKYLQTQDVNSCLASFLSQCYFAKIEIPKVTFKMYPIDHNKCFVIREIKNVNLHILKVYQQMNEKNVLVVNYQLEKNTQLKVISSFKSKEFTSIIIPIFSHTYELLIDTIMDVFKETSKAIYKKIIFITNETEIAKKLSENLQSQICAVSQTIKYEHFANQTQSYLLSKNFKFQGKNICLNELLSRSETINDILDEDTILKLINNLNYDIDSFDQKNYFYVERSLYYKIENPDSTLNTTVTLSENAICDYIIMENTKKIIVISDEPGMGKSFVISRLQKLLNNNCNFWIKKLNLSDYSDFFMKCSDEDSCNVEEFFTNMKRPTESKFERKLFNLSNRVILMLDAFDEISPDYGPLVSKLIKLCLSQNNIKNIVITTRPHCQKDIESLTKNSITYYLNPFSDEIRDNFLYDYWKNKLNIKSQEDKHKCKQYVEILTKTLFNAIGQNLKSLIGVPLQCRMIADIFKDKCLEFIRLSDNNKIQVQQSPVPVKINIFDLYEMFFNKKKLIFMVEKNRAGSIVSVKEYLSEAFDEAIEQHTKLALTFIFNENEYEYFDIFQKSLKTICATERILRMGILKEKEGKLQFVHQTFAEYLVARYLCNCLRDHCMSVQTIESVLYACNNSITLSPEQFTNPKKKFVRLLFFLIEVVFLKQEYNLIRLFMEKNLERQSFTKEFMQICGAITKTFKARGSKLVVPDDLAKNACYNLLTCMLANCDDVKHIDIDRLFRVGLGHFSIFKFLLEKGANLNQVVGGDTFGMRNQNNTLLHLAAAVHSDKVVQYLINEGFNVSARNSHGYTPLHLAFRQKATSVDEIDRLINIVRCIFENDESTINVRSRHYDDSLLHWAAIKNSVPLINLLLDLNFDIKVKNRSKESALHSAGRYGSIDVISVLLNAGLGIDETDILNFTPFLTACAFNKFECAHYFMNRGCNIHCTSFTWFNALHYIADSTRGLDVWNTEIVKKLLSNLGFVNAFNTWSKTPILLAASHKNVQLIKMLLDAGADITIGDSMHNGEDLYSYLEQIQTQYFEEQNKKLQTDILNKT